MENSAKSSERVHSYEEKIERLGLTVDELKKAVQELQRSQDETLMRFEDRFQKLEDNNGRTSKAPSRENRGARVAIDQGTVHELHPGPIDESVLTLQYDHRSTAIWRGQDFEPLTCRRCDGAFWRLGTLDPRIQRLMIQAGFYGVYKAGHIQLDHALITALVERWRQETHTFHLPVGEATVTLQDVSVMWGLPIGGDPVAGHDIARSTEEWQKMCEDLLGFKPPLSAFDSGRLKLKSIEDRIDLEPLQPDAPDHVVQFYARAHILQLLGGLLLPDASNNKVKLMFLPLLKDFEASGRLSWGSAVLASLYRALCRATKSNVDGVCGPLVLLQLWAWERIPLIRPERLVPRQQPLIDVGGHHSLPSAPYGSRWDVGFKLEKVGMHVLVVYRDMLDCMKGDQFVWQPYADVIDSLPEYCLSGRSIWQTVSPLICFDVVEFHFPDRVLRQFGQHQGIPANCDTVRDLHSVDRRGRQNTDWVLHHKQYIDMWANRHSRIVSAPPMYGLMDYSDPYMIWYRRITRLLIGNPANRTESGYQGVGGIIELMAQSLQRIYYRCVDALDQGDEGSKPDVLKEILDTCAHALQGAHEDRRLTLRPDLAFPASATNSSGPSQVKRRKSRRGGKILGGLANDRSGFSAADYSSPSTPFMLLPSTCMLPTSHSPSQCHEAFASDTEPYVTVAAHGEHIIGHQDCSFGEPMVLTVSDEPYIEQGHSLSAPKEEFPATPNLIEDNNNTSDLPRSPNDLHPNISELDNMNGAIAVSPSAVDITGSEPSAENSLQVDSGADDSIMQTLRKSQRPKVRKRKVKS